MAMQRRRQKQISSAGLDEEGKALLEANAAERELMETEIQELRERSERRKVERAEEEKEQASRRAEEEQRRKTEEEERTRKKREEEDKKHAERDAKLAEFKKFESLSKPNFVISKKGGGTEGEEGDEESGVPKKSKEQLEAEKKAILAQRIKSLDIDGADHAKLAEKARELHAHLHRLESEKYDLEKRFKAVQYDMMELAERARSVNKVGKGGLKRVQVGQDDTDKIQERFAGAPAKVEMYSRYERQKDKRVYGERATVFAGPTFCYPAEKVAPSRQISWGEDGLPQYKSMGGAAAAPAEEEEAAEEE